MKTDLIFNRGKPGWRHLPTRKRRLSPAVATRRPPAKPGSLQEKINRIFGPLALIRPGTGSGDDHQAYLGAIEERYLGW